MYDKFEFQICDQNSLFAAGMELFALLYSNMVIG